MPLLRSYVDTYVILLSGFRQRSRQASRVLLGLRKALVAIGSVRVHDTRCLATESLSSPPNSKEQTLNYLGKFFLTWVKP